MLIPVESRKWTNGGYLYLYIWKYLQKLGLPGGSDGKGSACNAAEIPASEWPLEKGTATHSSILAWRIRWTDEPVKKQFMGSQRVGHN